MSEGHRSQGIVVDCCSPCESRGLALWAMVKAVKGLLLPVVHCVSLETRLCEG